MNHPEPKEFRGADFALGSIMGVRTFGVHKEGLLQGLVFKQIWRPGENRAVCMKKGVIPVGDGPTTAEAMARLKKLIGSSGPHVGGHMMNCDCGYYAFYSDVENYYYETIKDRSDRFCGIIEGYGLTVQGPKGFKAEKARIVALLVPDVSKFPAETTEEYLWRNKTGRVRIDEDIIARTQRLYDVPFFTSYEQMLSEFPITQSSVYTGIEEDISAWETDGGLND